MRFLSRSRTLLCQLRTSSYEDIERTLMHEIQDAHGKYTGPGSKQINEAIGSRQPGEVPRHKLTASGMCALTFRPPFDYEDIGPFRCRLRAERDENASAASEPLPTKKRVSRRELLDISLSFMAEEEAKYSPRIRASEMEFDAISPGENEEARADSATSDHGSMDEDDAMNEAIARSLKDEEFEREMERVLASSANEHSANYAF
ncbi:uncharacterized protein RCO7_01528 [Rhynchosporium graminicola]|uniref:Uncharacterized protein n=1 Tax=Rhynchosporium graminicola TaxID=2792576 RepID=A0A1E1JZP9_9HELO|nr:uncharacterized protein RCO7_01528 [Rhynchosporium commune]